MSYKKQKNKGSILVFTLIVMFFVLVSALAIAASSVMNMNSANDSGKSAQAFQVANSGEEVIQGELKAVLSPQTLSLLSPQICSGNTVSGNINGDVNKSYTIAFYKNDTDTVPLNCSSDHTYDVKYIKSVGTYGGTTRAVKVPVCIPPTPVNTGPNMVALYHLEDAGTNAGSIIRDSSSTGSDGSIIGGSLPSTSAVCKGKQFNGNNSNYISVPDNANLRLGSSMTVEAWVKWSGSGNSWMRIVGKGSDPNRNYGLWMNPSNPGGIWLFQIYNGSGMACNAFSTGITSVDQNWHYLVGTYDGVACKLYVDGKYVGTQPLAIAPATSSDPLIIGAGVGTSSSNAFNGIVDEVKLMKITYAGPNIIGNDCNAEPSNNVCLQYTGMKSALGL